MKETFDTLDNLFCIQILFLSQKRKKYLIKYLFLNSVLNEYILKMENVQ